MEGFTELYENMKILAWVVDDNRPYCVILSEVINKSQTVLCRHYFTSAREALIELEATPFRPQVILLDISMPRLSGIDAIQHILRIAPETIIIMLTSMMEEEAIVTALKRGAKGYILKSSTYEDIIRSIEQCVGGGMPIDPMVMQSLLRSVTDAPDPVHEFHLSRRETEIIRLVMNGRSSTEIAQALTISYFTVETHLKNIYKKMAVPNRHALVAKAMKEGLV